MNKTIKMNETKVQKAQTTKYTEDIKSSLKPFFTQLDVYELTVKEYIDRLMHYQRNEMRCTPEHVIGYLSVIDGVEALSYKCVDANEDTLDEEIVKKTTIAVKVNYIDNGFSSNIWLIVIVNDMIQCMTLHSTR